MNLGKHKRRRHGYRGLARKFLTFDLGTTQRNVALGAGLNVAGTVILDKIPVVGPALKRIPVIGEAAPGLTFALAVAALNWFQGKKQAASAIALGAGAVSLPFILQQTGLVKSMGLVTTDLSAVVPTVEMSDGSSRALSYAEMGGPNLSVTQGLAGLTAASLH